MALAGKLHSERKPELTQSNDRNMHVSHLISRPDTRGTVAARILVLSADRSVMCGLLPTGPPARETVTPNLDRRQRERGGQFVHDAAGRHPGRDGQFG